MTINNSPQSVSLYILPVLNDHLSDATNDHDFCNHFVYFLDILPLFSDHIFSDYNAIPTFHFDLRVIAPNTFVLNAHELVWW